MLVRELVHAVACQGDCQVKAEAVNVEFFHPVAQRIHGHLDHVRVAEVQRIPAPGRVIVMTVAHAVVLLFGQSAPAVGGAAGATFSRVVVHHIKDHFDPCRMQQPDHAF